MSEKGLLTWLVVITINVLIAYQYGQQLAREISLVLHRTACLLGW